MAFFPTASQAKDRAQGNLVIAKEVNAIDLLLREYKNVKIYSETTEIKIDN